jgi:isopenicillin N synthase-like dioxygenase
MIPIPRAASADEVPVLNLQPWLAGGSPDELVALMRSACTTTGFFYIAGHGLAAETLADLFSAMRRYFDIPLEQRMVDLVDERFRRGYMPFGMNRHAGFKADLKESYEFGLHLPLTDPDVIAGVLRHGPNRWPAIAPWLQPAAEAYHRHVLRLGKDLLRLFALTLDQPEDFFLEWCKKPMAQTRLFHYPPQPAGDETALGVAPHTDYGMLTILAQDPIGGLELKKRDGEWVGAPYIEGTLVVNLGDLVKIWTNDRYVSNQHRVINRTGKERFSIPTFFNMDFNTPVQCLGSCLSVGETAKYPPIRAGDYIAQRVAAVQGHAWPR